MSETIKAIRAIVELMAERGWDKGAAPGCVKRDEAGKLVAKWGSPEFMRDLDDVKDTLIAREALAEINRRASA
jgi:hypothetical protein